jgi:hypothetical protein
MHEAIAPALLSRWENFYVIVGSSAAALTGLQFVVIALAAEIRQRNTTAVDAFSTPTIVHFSTVLLLAAILCAPWNGLSAAATLIALCGAAGVVYAGLVTRRARRQTIYRMVLEDWLWHIAFPFLAHAMLLGAGLSLVRRPTGALFTIATASLLLLFIGIHNAWDTSTYMVMQRLESERKGGDRQEPPADSSAKGHS